MYTKKVQINIFFLDLDIVECDSNPCLHGNCLESEINMYSCNCAGTGYEGDQCQTGKSNIHVKSVCDDKCVDKVKFNAEDLI